MEITKADRARYRASKKLLRRDYDSRTSGMLAALEVDAGHWHRHEKDRLDEIRAARFAARRAITGYIQCSAISGASRRTLEAALEVLQKESMKERASKTLTEHAAAGACEFFALAEMIVPPGKKAVVHEKLLGAIRGINEHLASASVVALGASARRGATKLALRAARERLFIGIEQADTRDLEDHGPRRPLPSRPRWRLGMLPAVPIDEQLRRITWLRSQLSK